MNGKRVLITHADRYMGKPMTRAFSDAGAEVITDTDPLASPDVIDELLERAGDIDIFIANFADDPIPQSFANVTDENIARLFNTIVFPFMTTVRKVGGAMKKRGRGKIIAVTSAAPLRGLPGFSAYVAARGAQNAFVRTVGLELAGVNVQFNAIAQNFVKNERYYPDELINSDAFKQNWLPQIPTGKVAEEEETAELALYLASDKCTHMVGQVIPWAGGWVTTTG